MIDSCLERPKQTIVLDRILVKEPNKDPYLELDPTLIKKNTALHFQTVAGAQNIEVTDPTSLHFSDHWAQWEPFYQPLSNIDDDVYDQIMDAPTYDEWLLILKHLPNDKAPGPSNISNEFLKKLGPLANKFLFKIICACFSSGLTPRQWNIAHVYPIPKPKPWNCDLNNTRPITLLETIRKAFTKILNARLQKILIKSNALSGLNFAGLPHQSTLEPLHIINNHLEYHRSMKETDSAYKKDLHILFQDMSKAYDRVNIFMLKKALFRLKFPSTLINLIVGLFLNRSNAIFTDFGLTDLYDVLVGIDQGEVISPLLWVIYYDPLFDRIKKSGLGFNMSST